MFIILFVGFINKNFICLFGFEFFFMVLRFGKSIVIVNLYLFLLFGRGGFIFFFVCGLIFFWFVLILGFCCLGENF